MLALFVKSAMTRASLSQCKRPKSSRRALASHAHKKENINQRWLVEACPHAQLTSTSLIDIHKPWPDAHALCMAVLRMRARSQLPILSTAAKAALTSGNWSNLDGGLMSTLGQYTHCIKPAGMAQTPNTTQFEITLIKHFKNMELNRPPTKDLKSGSPAQIKSSNPFWCCILLCNAL